MQKIFGILRKMPIEVGSPLIYTLQLGDHRIPLNDYLGQDIKLQYTGEIFCIQCGRKTSKSFQQGHCFPCMRRLAECDCILHPEKCQVEQGTCPKDDWAHVQCFQNHVVYLANSSGLKVGITRHSQVPTRWLDQGAVQALPIYQVSNRYQSGVVEVCLKAFVSDRTDWRRLLKSAATYLDLPAERDRLLERAGACLSDAIAQFPNQAIQPLRADKVRVFEYPIQQYPEKISSLSFDKSPMVSGRLNGMKGQYLILDSGVINIRKFSGYQVEWIKS